MVVHTISTNSIRSLRTYVIVVLLGMLAACSQSDVSTASPKAAKTPPLPVTVIEVQPTRIPVNMEAVGETEGARGIEIHARVGGFMLKRLYQEGAPVEAGQALFQIDRIPLEIELAQAQAELAKSKAQMKQAKREAARLKRLTLQKIISEREYDDAITVETIAQATLKAATARVRKTELNLSYTTVITPIAGISGRALRSEGSLLSIDSNSLLTTVVQLDPIWVRFSLSDNELAQLPDGRLIPGDVHNLKLVLANGSVQPNEGRLNFVASHIDPQLGTLQLRAEFDNPDARILPGQFVRVRVSIGLRHNVYLVPQTAVMQSDTGHYVFVVGSNNTTEIRTVEVGEWRGRNWVILAGLEPGTKVILDNLLKMRPGMLLSPQLAINKPTNTNTMLSGN